MRKTLGGSRCVQRRSRAKAGLSWRQNSNLQPQLLKGCRPLADTMKQSSRCGSKAPPTAPSQLEGTRASALFGTRASSRRDQHAVGRLAAEAAPLQTEMYRRSPAGRQGGARPVGMCHECNQRLIAMAERNGMGGISKWGKQATRCSGGNGGGRQLKEPKTAGLGTARKWHGISEARSVHCRFGADQAVIRRRRWKRTWRRSRR